MSYLKANTVELVCWAILETGSIDDFNRAIEVEVAGIAVDTMTLGHPKEPVAIATRRCAVRP